MAASLDKTQVDELIEKYRALAEKGQRRVDELEERNEHLVDALLSSLIVPTSAFGLSYARAYFGERSSIFGIAIDAAVGLLLKGLATLLGFSSDREAQTAAKIAHDVGNGALASWSAAAGTALGTKKRLVKPLPAPQPSTGGAEMPKFGPGPLTHEDLAAIRASMELSPTPVQPTAMPQHSPLNAHPPTTHSPRRSLAAARTVGITEAMVTPSPQMQFTRAELEAAERCRLAAAA